MIKYTVEYDEDHQSFEVVEWRDSNFKSHVGQIVSKFYDEEEANHECAILIAGYEYTMSANIESEWDLC